MGNALALPAAKIDICIAFLMEEVDGLSSCFRNFHAVIYQYINIESK